MNPPGATKRALRDRLAARTYVIAEIGVNHGGDVQLALRMIEAAQAAGADAVKFQTFTAQSLVTHGTPKVRYQQSTTDRNESHYDMIRRLELPRADHVRALAASRRLGVDFISTPYDVDSARFLVEELHLDVMKVASADLVDTLLNRYLASAGCGVILSTGMASMAEIAEALAIYSAAGHDDLCLLQCVSNYPCSDASLHLRTMQTLATEFGLPVGFSDHTADALAAALSVALGGRIVEKHFTLDKSLPGPDHKASATPAEFAALVADIRRAETMLGRPEKRLQDEERQMAEVSRKSIVAARDIAAGATLDATDLTLKRPGTGLRGAMLDRLVGARVRRPIAADEQVTLADVELRNG